MPEEQLTEAARRSSRTSQAVITTLVSGAILAGGLYIFKVSSHLLLRILGGTFILLGCVGLASGIGGFATRNLDKGCAGRLNTALMSFALMGAGGAIGANSKTGSLAWGFGGVLAVIGCFTLVTIFRINGH